MVFALLYEAWPSFHATPPSKQSSAVADGIACTFVVAGCIGDHLRRKARVRRRVSRKRYRNDVFR